MWSGLQLGSSAAQVSRGSLTVFAASLAMVLGCATTPATGGRGPEPHGNEPGGGNEADHERPAALAGRTLEGCFVTDDAPDPFACTSASDCTSGGLYDAARCCMTGVTHAHSIAYHTWQTEAFRAACDGTCIQPPARPLDCQLQLRCVEGRCRDGCE